MTTWSDIVGHRHLISRTFYGTPGSQTITMPAKAAFVRVSLVGAGGWGGDGFLDGIVPSGSFGGGAAFARTKAACSPSDTYTLQVGDIAHSSGAGSGVGDSIFTKISGSVVVAKAQRGGGDVGGLASGSVGDTTRSGSAPPDPTGANTSFEFGGASAGDDADTFPLGFGGRSYFFNKSSPAASLAAAPGGGGVANLVIYYNLGAGYQVTRTFPPGNGRACIEVFDEDPALIWPGY